MAESMGLDRLPEFASIRAAAETIAGEGERLAALCIEIQQIPAPTGAEELRADWVQARFRQLGLADIDRDGALNVYGRIPGKQSTPALLVSAHTDTVFPASTDLTVRTDPETGRIAGPSIGDNSTGLAGLMVLAEVLAGIEQPPVDIWLVANSTEEGLGDLKGIRAAVDRLPDRRCAGSGRDGTGADCPSGIGRAPLPHPRPRAGRTQLGRFWQCQRHPLPGRSGDGYHPTECAPAAAHDL